MELTGRQRYAAILAVAAVIILSVGSWFKPAPTPKNPRLDGDMNVTRAELDNLQQLVRRNSLRNLSTSFSDVAGKAIEHLVLIQPWNTNAAFVQDLGLIVAKRLGAVPHSLTVVAGSNSYSITPNLWVPGVPFLLSRLPDGLISPARLSDSTPDMGGWVIVVANGVFGQTLVSPGIYNGISQENCGPFIRYRLLTTVPLNSTHLGGGLFDLAGNLQGVVLPCEDGPAVVPVSEIQRAIASVNNDTGKILARYGFRLAPGGTPDAPATVVTEVWDGWPAAQARIEPGDQLLSIDSQTPSTAKDAIATLMVDQADPHELRISRGGKTIRTQLAAVSRVSPGARTGLTVDDASGVAISQVPKGSSADNAGLQPGDHILTIDGRPATRTSVQRTFSQLKVPEPLQLVIQRPGRRQLITVLP